MAEAAVQEQEQTERVAQGSAATGESAGESAPLTRTGAMGFGLAPRNFDEGWRMASVFAKSSLVPKQYQDKPEDIIIAMQYGAEIGLPPMAALQSVAVINGKPGVYGDGFLGVIMSKPAYQKHLEFYELPDGTRVKGLRSQDYVDETKAVAMFWRRGNPEPFVGEFSIADAKRAKLWGKEGPWTTYPARQMKWRARGFAGRDGFSAELRGVKMAEELLDTPDDIEVSDIHQPIPEPLRLSERASIAESTAAGTTTAPATEHPALTNELPPAGNKAATTKSVGKGSTAPAAAKKSAPNPDDGPSVTTESMVITNTQHCTPKDEEPYTEVTGVVKKAGAAPVAMIFVTRDKALADTAASCEGTDTLVNIAWHGGKRPNGKACKVLERILAAN